MTSVEQLKIGNRYTFYETDKIYRGTFLEYRSITHRIPRFNPLRYIYVLYQENTEKNPVIKIINMNQIQRIETLSQIFDGGTILPDDVLSVIDQFL
jgi:hypothetical protein